jgi:hypothetical protein
MDSHAGYPAAMAGHGARAQLVQRLSAVRDVCIAMRKTVFADLARRPVFRVADGGVTLSQAVRRAGLNVVWTPHSALGTQPDTLERRPLGPCILGSRYDPNYNPNLFGEEGDFTFAWPPLDAGFGPS